jgi:hypothetical protein
LLTIEELEVWRISLAEITGRLLDEGAAAFLHAFDTLLAAIERRRLAAT